MFDFWGGPNYLNPVGLICRWMVSYHLFTNKTNSNLHCFRDGCLSGFNPFGARFWTPPLNLKRLSSWVCFKVSEKLNNLSK